MKTKLFLIIFLIFTAIIACNSRKESNQQNSDLLFDSIAGYWYSTDYIDSTVINKKIFDYCDIGRHRYEIFFDTSKPETMHSKGYWEEFSDKIVKISSNQYLVNFDTLEIERIGNSFVINYKERYYNNKKKKHEWKSYLYKRKEKKIDNCADYFAENIFSGNYRVLENGTEIQLNGDFTIVGMDTIREYSFSLGYDEFSDYMDIIYLGAYTFHWRFEADTLKIFNVEADETTDGRPNGYKLKDLKYRLLK